MYVLEVQEKTIFARLKDIYPECLVLIEDEPKLHPLICFQTSCPRNMTCMEKLVKRVKAIFDSFPNAKLLLLYFEYRDQPGSIRAGVFYRDLREPYNVLFNRSGWGLLKGLVDRGAASVYEWELPAEVLAPVEDGRVHLPVISDTENINKGRK